MVFLIQQTLLFAVPLMIVALAGVCAERSGVINLALEGIMIFGAFIGVLFIRVMQETGMFEQEQGQILMLLTMVVSAVCGALFSLLLAFIGFLFLLFCFSWLCSKQKCICSLFFVFIIKRNQNGDPSIRPHFLFLYWRGASPSPTLKKP